MHLFSYRIVRINEFCNRIIIASLFDHFVYIFENRHEISNLFICMYISIVRYNALHFFYSTKCESVSPTKNFVHDSDCRSTGI